MSQEVTTKPLAVLKCGERLQCRLAEVRGDWKWVKDGCLYFMACVMF